MDINTLALFALTEFLASLTPGPAVLLVIGLSIRQGFQIGFMATLGILTTNALFFTLSALGVGALILTSATLFTIVKWIGAAYLVYIGIGMVAPLLKRMWRARSIGAGLNLAEAKAAAPKAPQSKVQSFWKGFSVSASNPKNIAYFVAILPQFISPDGNVAMQFVVLGVLSVLIELPIMIFFGVASAASARLLKERAVEWIEAIGGGILVVFGGALAASNRTQ